MHNTCGRQSASLGTFSGTNTLAAPESLPHGASPRNQNVEYRVGGVRTRGPLVNPFTFANNSAGPSPGTAAGNAPITGGVAWQNFDNVLTDNGEFATVALSPLSISATEVISQAGAGTAINSVLIVSFEINVPAFAAGQTYTFSGLTNFTDINGLTLAALEPGTVPDLDASQAAFILATSGGGQPAIPVRPTTADTGDASVSGFNFTTFSDALTIKQFGFNVAETATPQGFIVKVPTQLADEVGLFVQILKNGVPVGTPQGIIPTTPTVTFGSINDLFGDSWTAADINNTEFGVQITANAPLGATTAFVGFVTLQVFFLPSQSNFQHISTFEDDFGDIYSLALDADGTLWIEDVINNPDVLTSLATGLPANAFASMFTANSRRYMAFSNLLSGVSIPQQYTGMAPGLQGGWIDRISKVGPGQAPTFTPISTTADQFAISTITQAAAVSHASAYFLQSSGPGSTAPGNVITFYYTDSTVNPNPDPGLVAAFNSGQPVFALVSFAGISEPFGPMVVQITSVGEGQPPSQPRQFFYFTFNVSTVAFTLDPGSGHPDNVANYQLSLATMTTAVPVPGLTIGNSIAITGSSVEGYNTTFTISQTPNSGSFTITETEVVNSVATYSYSLINGSDPTEGQLVTITGTNNANGGLNLVNATIVSASGGDTGTFTVNVSVPDAAATTEEGQATTAGDVFCFDPGAALVGSTTSSPIFGDATGGELIFQGTGQFVAPGTRQGTVFFIDRDGYWSKPAPPVTFSASGDTITGIQANNIPIGPPSCVARAIVFTEAGANGVPGASFYTIPEPVQFIVNNVTFNTSSLFINDNTTTSATFFFTDSVLLDATEIDIQGNDLFNLGELGNAAWGVLYAGRSVFGRVDNKIQNFLNLSFDGGFLANPGGNLLPLGWNVLASSVIAGSPPTLNVSPIFGNSYFLENNSGATVPVFGLIYQSAFQDVDLVAILQNQTGYSVRVVCRTPASSTVGSLVVDLTNFDAQSGFGSTFGTFTLPLSQMSSTFAQFTGVLLDSNTLTIPSSLQLRVWALELGNGANLEIDHIEIFPTADPVDLTGLSISYQDDYESFDLVTGGQDTVNINNQPANGGFVMHNTLYILKESSMGLFNDTPNQEPANWQPYAEVSNVAGACGINAFDVGEEWSVMGCRNGLFLFNGGQPTPIQIEINDIWQAINWEFGYTMCIRNDVANRRILCAIPLPTPNPWMVDATVNSNPETPNVILALDYKGIGTIEELISASAMHVTMMGKVAVQDLRRKWSLWTIPTPFMGMVKRNRLLSLMMFGNGIGSSKIYQLGPTPTGMDDGVPFTSSYCTYGFVDATEAEQEPMFGEFNKRFAYVDLLAKGSGTADLTLYQNTLEAPYPYEIPGGVTLTDPAANDLEYPLDEFAMRMFCEIVMENGWFDLSRFTLVGAKDRWATTRGV
jgi:hypothetical protein